MEGGWRDRGGGRMVIVYNYSYKNKQDYPMLHETKQLDPLSTHPVLLHRDCHLGDGDYVTACNVPRFTGPGFESE